MKQTEDGRNKDECGYSREQQPADHSASQWRILLSTFTSAQCHGHHPDNHRQCGHCNGTKPGRTCFNGCKNRVSVNV